MTLNVSFRINCHDGTRGKWSFHSGDYEHYCPVGRDTVKRRRYEPTFQRAVLCRPSILITKPESSTKTQVHIYETTRRHTPQAPAATLSGPIAWMLPTQNPPISKVLGPSAGNSLEEHSRYNQLPRSDGTLLRKGRYNQLLQWLTPYYRNFLLSTHIRSIWYKQNTQ
jgi:hypothetical protein